MLTLQTGAPEAPDLFLRPYIAGIGGIGTSGVALVLRDLGPGVAGSDIRPSEVTDALISRGIEVAFATDPNEVMRASCLIVPSFFPKDHPAIVAAREASIPILTRAEALSLLCRDRVAHVTLCLGTMARAYAAWLLAQACPDCGWCIGATLLSQARPHARFSSRRMILDLDERALCEGAFPHGDIVFSDFCDEHLGYYPQGFDFEGLMDRASRDPLRHVVFVRARAAHRFVVIHRHARTESHFDFGVRYDARGALLEEGAGRSARRFARPVGPNLIESYAAALVYAREVLHIDISDDPQTSCTGWWNQIHQVCGHIHDIRMHPVNIFASLCALKAFFPVVHLAIKPFISTLRAYDEGLWARAMAPAADIAVITPPYEGLGQEECTSFVEGLRRTGLDAYVLAREQLSAQMAPDDAWLVVGGPDVAK